MKSLLAGLAIAMALAALPAAAAEGGLPEIDGLVQRVDKDRKRLTIRHGPLPNLEMPAMTMVFQVAQDAFLDQAKPGDSVRFTVDKINGAYTVMSLKPATRAASGEPPGTAAGTDAPAPAGKADDPHAGHH